MNRKLLSLLLVLALAAAAFTACGGGSGESSGGGEAPEGGDALTVVKIGASPTPHALILEEAREEMEAAGYELQIVEFEDYVLPNEAVSSGDLNANYFQHQPYLDQYNEENGTDLVSVGKIHYEPFGIFAGKTASLSELSDGAQISVPNDATNEARALLLLEQEGLIKLKEGVGIGATKLDIVENPKNLDIIELEAAMLPRSLTDVDLAVINGNYALGADLNPAKDALALESADGLAAETFGNIIAVVPENADDAGVKALVEILKGDKVRSFIESEFDGAVVPVE